MGAQGPVVVYFLRKDLGPVLEGRGGGGGGGQRVAIATNTADLSPPRTRPLKPRTRAVPSLLGAVVDSVPHLCQNVAAAQAPEGGCVGENRLLPLPSHDEIDALGAGGPVAVKKSNGCPLRRWGCCRSLTPPVDGGPGRALFQRRQDRRGCRLQGRPPVGRRRDERIPSPNQPAARGLPPKGGGICRSTSDSWNEQ